MSSTNEVKTMQSPALLLTNVTIYGGEITKQNPRGLESLDAGDIVDSARFSPSHRAHLIASGMLASPSLLDEETTDGT